MNKNNDTQQPEDEKISFLQPILVVIGCILFLTLFLLMFEDDPFAPRSRRNNYLVPIDSGVKTLPARRHHHYPGKPHWVD